MAQPKGFIVVPGGKRDECVLIAGPGRLLMIDLTNDLGDPLPPAMRKEIVEYARRIVEVLNASPMGQEPRRS